MSSMSFISNALSHIIKPHKHSTIYFSILFVLLANVNLRLRSLYVVVCRLSSVVRNVRSPYTQAIEIFGNLSTPFGTLAICDPSVKILRRSSQGNPSVGGLTQRGVEKCSDFGPFQGHISETVQDRR